MFEWINKAAGHNNTYGPSGLGLFIGVSIKLLFYEFLAGNNITTRGANIIDHIPSTQPSRNMIQAHFKALRLFRKICRLVQ